MHITLYGDKGKLGQEILRIINYPYRILSRVDVSSDLAFDAWVCQQKEKTILLDVSLPDGTQELVSQLKKINSDKISHIGTFVVGTTGHKPEGIEALYEISKKIPVCLVPNFSKGVALFSEILQAKTKFGLSVADLTRELGFELGFIESHHKAKRDVPSGTAKMLASQAGLGVNSVVSLRLGEIVAEHTLVASAPCETITLTHTAHSRGLFAHGALSLCSRLWDAQPKPGWLDPQDYFFRKS